MVKKNTHPIGLTDMTKKNVLPKREQTVHNISYFNKKEIFTIRRKQKIIGSKTQKINIY